ncbi:hypothetical protein K435DRAFT_874537 [Dendrothele bispora CBS 962.96]|uniref:Uncharacterized protein n=1 Tax=Dendrothele bispora (strain CBS 962.96) TaxID=1314807 RepID=A0A4V4HBQ0_DENBC|nr:hypothetical protein K435DRAFT_874537 [Dendrothele bispora CBS 962.96]
MALGMLLLAGFATTGDILNMVNAKVFMIFLLGLLTILVMFLLVLKEVGDRLKNACIRQSSSEGV